MYWHVWVRNELCSCSIVIFRPTRNTSGLLPDHGSCSGCVFYSKGNLAASWKWPSVLDQTKPGWQTPDISRPCLLLIPSSLFWAWHNPYIYIDDTISIYTWMFICIYLHSIQNVPLMCKKLIVLFVCLSNWGGIAYLAGCLPLSLAVVWSFCLRWAFLHHIIVPPNESTQQIHCVFPRCVV